MSAQPKPYVTLEEYLELELHSEIKHEYHDGEMFAMSGGTLDHSGVAVNIIIALGIQLRDRPCRVFNSDMRIKIEATGLYTYPDISVVSGQPQLEGGRKDTLLNPILLVEVLSPSTEGYDRGTKFENYRTIPCLQEFLIVSADKPAVERFTRQADGSWNLIEAKGRDAHMPLTSLSCRLELADVYAKIEFGGG